MIKLLKKINQTLLWFGFNLKALTKLVYIKKFIFDYLDYKKKGGKVNKLYPIINEHKLSSDKSDVIQNNSHYFNQDLLVANYINKTKPNRHVDIGSRIDGFVSNVASFRKIEIFDIRKNKIFFENIKFKRADITRLNKKYFNYSDSVSCLHTIEHIGLGRYGDEIDPEGHIKAFNNLKKILKKNGILYISFPLSKKTKVHFNAHRTFEKSEILKWIEKDLKLINFDFINDQGELFKSIKLSKISTKNLDYGLGIYTFKKLR